MYLVPSVVDWVSEHVDLEVVVPQEEVPDGVVIGFNDPAGNTFYIFDQHD